MAMSIFKKNMVFFVTGGVGYGTLELLCRRRTHWSMVCAGGLSFVMFSKVAEVFGHRSRLFKAAVCSVGVTAIEFVFGVVFNLILKKNVWDYSRNRFHILGQICPLFSALWGVLGFVFIPLAETMNKRLTR